MKEAIKMDTGLVIAAIAAVIMIPIALLGAYTILKRITT